MQGSGSTFRSQRRMAIARPPSLVALAYLSAALGPTAVVVGKFLFVDPSADAPFLLFFAQIVLAGALGGFRPALLATGTSAIWVTFLLVPPVASFAVADPDVLRVLAFTLEGVAVSGLVGWLHRSWRDSREALIATRAANDRVREAWRDRSLLLAEASEEARQPLARLLSQLQSARKELAKVEPGSPLVHKLDSAAEAARSLNDLTQELLYITRADSGYTGHSTGPVDLTDLAREVVASCARQGQVELELRGGTLMPIVGDRGALRRVLENLVANALQYGGDLPVRVELAIDPSRQEGLVRIHDSGRGIPESERERIFEPFYRAADPRATAGHGLGLWIARRLAQQHGGRLWVERSGASGTTVTMAIPLARKA